MYKQNTFVVAIGLLLLAGLIGAAVVQASNQTPSGLSSAPGSRDTETVTDQMGDAPGPRMLSVTSATRDISERSATKSALIDQRKEELVQQDEDEIAREVKALVEQWSASLLNGAGWIHLVVEHDRSKDEVGTLPTGQPIPMDYVSDNWYELNSQGLVKAAVAIMRDQGGQPVQVSTFRNGMWRNLTVGEAWPGSEPSFALRLDFGFSNDVAQAREWGSTVSRQEESIVGRPALLFTLRDDHANPVRIAGFEKRVTSGQSMAAFDTQTGQMLYAERALIMVDGEQRVVERTNTLIVERVTEPPADVLAFLNREVIQ